jgi:hypothetical protein
LGEDCGEAAPSVERWGLMARLVDARGDAPAGETVRNTLGEDCGEAAPSVERWGLMARLDDARGDAPPAGDTPPPGEDHAEVAELWRRPCGLSRTP